MAFKERKETIEEQKISLTIEFVKDALGSHCTDFMAEEVLKQKYPRQKINEIKTAFVRIEKAAGERAKEVFYALAKADIGRLFVQNPDAFVQIATVTGKWAGRAFRAFGNPVVGSLFSQNPDLIIEKFTQIAKATQNGVGWVLGLLEISDIGKMFVQAPDAFVEIAKETKEWTGNAFWALAKAEVGTIFKQNPQLFVEIARAAARGAGGAFGALCNIDKDLLNELIENPKKTMDRFMFEVVSLEADAVIDLGRPLDELHNNKKERQNYLQSLSATQVLTLLLSNPEFFYTSTNHMLFDRLNKNLGGGSKVALFEKEGLLETKPLRNLLFRAMNYDRMIGNDGIFSPQDMDLIKPTLFSPILEENGFDFTYYYLVANNLEEIKKYGLEVDLRRYSSESKNADAKTNKAHEFLLNALDEKVENPRAYYSPDLYTGKDGKLNIMQIFNKKDTESDHWGLTQEWFSKYGKPKMGESGELIYETENARITLFMGESDMANQEFINAKVAQDPNMIISFRGHSFSLLSSFPYDIFENSDGHVLFIPGSCGSAGSVPNYLNENPMTDLRHFSNTSTGRGQVTNAIIDILISANEGKFEDILKENSAKIMANGGDIATIKVWSLGEQLISHVNKP